MTLFKDLQHPRQPLITVSICCGATFQPQAVQASAPAIANRGCIEPLRLYGNSAMTTTSAMNFQFTGVGQACGPTNR
jgi:hypothetical protein